MTDAIEGNVMVKPLNDTNNFKHNQKQLWASKLANNKASHAKQLALIKELISDLPEVNKARVEFLKGEIASGRYHISNDQIAAKMIADIEIA
ncbi:MAG: flagellar biosynthesis anti-sigma factor FlgM [Tatlockia sp.]|nr:flagellar biosynthesis anti-sigma factor FlgM [Tatlockia sp.]